MSNRAINWAIEAQVPDGSCRLILMLLANRANGSAEAWPSLHRLGREAVLDKATVCRKLAVLEQLGLITRVQQRDPKTRSHQPTHYRLNLPPLVAQCDKGLSHRATSLVAGCDTNPKEEPRPLPPGWGPSQQDLVEMKQRYPELDIDAATQKFTRYFTRNRRLTHHDWPARWREWLEEDSAHPRRGQRSATGAARTDGVIELNRRRAAAVMARITAVSHKR